MNDKVRLAVVGCGDIAVTRHIPTIMNHSETELVALCDSDITRVKPLASQNGVRSCTDDYRTLLTDDGIDAVIVATPPWVTPKITMDFLKAGKDVLCEKPMALDLETAKQVSQVEEETGRKVQIGFTYRHDPLLEKLRDWIRADRLGSPLVFRLGIYDEIWDPIGNPEHYDRIHKTMEHGIPSIHDGAHIADFLNMLTDSPVSHVEAFGLQSRPEFPTSNYDTSVIRFANGDMAKLEISWFYPVFPQGEFEVLGPKGLAVFDRFKRYVELRTRETTEREVHEEDWWESCFRIQLDRFVAGIRSEHPFVPGTSEGIYSLSLTKAIEISMERNKNLFSGGINNGISKR
ncbi:Gfo/Idh/MocA family protein [Cohnella silvisoli]|uniref:Gfo/Idh/MocA family oxidoreductase n=1 Tax=Cohnella silvisoli TaxID=2873699 RepID=A0ABV1L3J9_9BACL|nr:Gfo/Idh/MocA family oxidoreductase [Cohnella silvisoli]MCD9026247.1 Gfo/Idh/MocA family oxidoreductase [Cohnella silvisoli]